MVWWWFIKTLKLDSKSKNEERFGGKGAMELSEMILTVYGQDRPT